MGRHHRCGRVCTALARGEHLMCQCACIDCRPCKWGPPWHCLGAWCFPLKKSK